MYSYLQALKQYLYDQILLNDIVYWDNNACDDKTRTAAIASISSIERHPKALQAHLSRRMPSPDDSKRVKFAFSTSF
ncbi:hypothetical protein CEXT_217841 [Caerostris extrusa]|uniref:Uncharacterized protein n=1 Tax=Caerostris extrusa TaxID=172846 RepID=A0AAV4WT81_CAEEX|nr:hypothetical protein CEXT_217841 [Caerostris extrusa]